MIVSIATAVLPVWRSPMISSRWPRPIGVIASMTLTPVCTGVSTFCRIITPGGDDVDRAELLRIDRTFSIEWTRERVDDAADELLAHRGLDDATGGADLATFFDAGVVAEDDRAHGVLFEVERETEDVVAEVKQLRSEAGREPVDAGDAVADLHHGADVDRLRPSFELLDLRLDDVGDL